MEKKNLPAQNYIHFLNDFPQGLANTTTKLQGIDYI
jgi:hypothetical protein